MREQEAQDEPTYEVGQEQLDAVDRMLQELDLDEEFGRVPAAFRIVERFEQQQRQQQQQQDFSHSSINSYNENTSNGHGCIRSNNYMDMDTNNDTSDQIESDDDNDDDPAPFGYIPLDQGYSNLDDDEDEDEDDNNQKDAEGYDQMLSDSEVDHTSSKENNFENNEDDDDDDEGQGYDGYLRSVNRDGTMPIPVIPPPVQIDLEEADERSTEQIPEEDLKTIAMVMSSFSLPAPDWAKSIPEERWLPKIVQQAESSSFPSLSSLDKDRPLP